MRPEEIYSELADSGLTIEQSVEFTDQLVRQSKTASLSLLLASIPGGIERLTGAVKNLQQASYPAALAAAAAPPIIGYTAGNALARSLDSDKGDVDDIMQSELIAELNTAAGQLRRSRELGNRV